MSNGKHYEEEFKKQIVELINGRKTMNQISKEYGISSSTVHGWVKKYNNTGSFKASENRSEAENKMIKLEKENNQLRMENDILYPKGHAKQAALIIGRK